MPHPFDIQPPRDYAGPRFTGNVVEIPRRYLRPRLIAQATQDRGMLAATDDIAQRQRENLARFYRANPQFGPRPDEPQLSEAWFYVLGAVTALLWIAAFFVAGREGWF